MQILALSLVTIPTFIAWKRKSNLTLLLSINKWITRMLLMGYLSGLQTSNNLPTVPIQGTASVVYLVWVLASDVVDSGFEARSGKTRDYKHGICCFCAKHTVLRSKRRDSMARNELYMSEWNDMLDCFIGLAL